MLFAVVEGIFGFSELKLFWRVWHSVLKGLLLFHLFHLIVRRNILRESARDDRILTPSLLPPLGGRPRKRRALGYFCVRVSTKRKEFAMRLTSTEVERTLSQFEAEAIPDHHPAVPQLHE